MAVNNSLKISFCIIYGIWQIDLIDYYISNLWRSDVVFVII